MAEPNDDPLLTLRRETSDRAVVLHAAGEVDHLNAHRLSAELAKAGQAVSPAQRLVLDMTAVSFMGSAAIAALIEHNLQSRQNGRDLRIVTGNTTVARTLQRTGVLGLLPVHATLEDALADHP